MPLSRLENFLKNAEGNILYVNPSDFDATDSFENRGNSLTRPFRTIQRALLESARFSYQVGKNNDKIDRTTILVYPGTHYIDNRPGFSIQNISGASVFKRLVNGGWTTSGATVTEFSEFSNFDIFDEDNDLVKFNSINGGVILPRGTSIVGLDLRKTKIRPLYVPDPNNTSIPNSAIFRVTGTCYFTAFSFFDADPQRAAYKDQSGAKVAPNFSHHKLTCFEYADGVNLVELGSDITDLTDLEMYYYKITHAYGDTSGRGLANYPAASGTDFEPSIDEYRIVGDLRADTIGISSIKSGDGVIPTQTITVTTEATHGLFKDTPVLISGITTNITSYNGSFLVTDVIDETNFTFTAPEVPTDPLPGFADFVNSNVLVESDSVSSASPYVFSCTLRSVYGLNGLHADGSKATGFKSMLTAQFTGISLQKDDNAFIIYDEETGIYNDNLTVSQDQQPLHTNSRAIYKPGYENVHMKASNDSIIQCVSIFAIGYAKHFVCESGGDQSITNSNSNFGAIALEASGFRSTSFDRDDVGYITHIIPPREPNARTSAVSWLPLDATKIVSAAQTSKLWLSGYNSIDIAPPSQIDSYRVGAKEGEELYLTVILGNQQSTFRSPILMQVPSGIGTSAKKTYYAGRQAGINSVSSDIITLTENHQLFNGEKIRLYTDNGEMPSNIENNKVYYALTTGLNPNQIKLSATLNDANAGNNVTGISNNGGILQVLSTVADKVPGDPGHPIQYDTTERQWYVLGSQATFYNTIYDGIVGIGTSILGESTGATFLQRQLDNRGLEDRIYKVRYVVPKEFTNARPPSDGFILQESKNVGVGSASFISASVEDPTQLRNPRVIVGASYLSGTATIKTELPHNLITGDLVRITNIISSNNLTANSDIPYNGLFEVASVNNSKEFTYVGLSSDPGTFLSQTNQRSTQLQIESLPTLQREKYKDTLFIYRNTTIKEHIAGADGQDGIYLLTVLSGSITPNSNVGYGLSYKKFNQDIRNLYPQQDRDNYNSDPNPSITHAKLSPLGSVNTNDKRNSITREAFNIFANNNRIGYAITGAIITGTGNTTITLYTNVEHNLNRITGLTITNPGADYNNSAGIVSTMYSTELLNASITGRLATVKAVVGTSNTITSVEIVDGGCAYGIGNTMQISAGNASTPSDFAVVTVTATSNNVGDTLELSGFADPKYNGIFKVVAVPSSKSISILNTLGIGATYLTRNDERFPIAFLASKGVGVTSVTYDNPSGISTVVVNGSHGLVPGNSFQLVGTGNTYFSQKFFVSEVVGVSTFVFSAGVSTETQTFNASGITLHKFGYSANGRALGFGEENLGGRGQYIWAGVTTTTAAPATKADTSITLTSTNGISKGDYLLLSTEIVRVSATPVGSNITVSRGQFSTPKVDAESGTSIKKIRVLPMEIRRHSILRASGHTFEYLGFGPGNYSTGLPLKQDRVLSDDEILVSQAREQDGGTVVYTGMNDRGEFFSGATKIKGATGEEEVIEAPIVTYFGDDAQTEAAAKNSGTFDDLVVKERITVEGGENNNQTSQFYGPVNFSEKVTNTSENGLETRDLYIKGLASQPKLLTVGISSFPPEPKKSGDVTFLANPDPGYSIDGGVSIPGGHLGHVYSDGDWRRFGIISRDKNRMSVTLDQIAVGPNTSIYNWTDALEVNGTVKVKNLYVGGAVTFASNQVFSGVTYENIVINNQLYMVGNGGASVPPESIGPSHYTIKHPLADSLAQFANMEVTGAAVTMSSNTTLKLGGALHSVHPGISTFDGTLKVGNFISSTGVVTATEFKGDTIGVGTISIANVAYIQAGIMTYLDVTGIGTIASLYSPIGIVTNISGEDLTYTTVNATDTFSQGIRATSKFATPLAHINTGVITDFTSTRGGITYLTGTISTTTNARITDWVGSPTAYVNTGIITNITARTIRGTSAADPLTAFINVGVVTCITGVAGTFTHLRANTSLVANNGLYANIGFVTHVNGTQQNLSGVSTAQRYVSTVATGTAPLTVTSTTKVTNLNADLLDGLNTSSTDTTGASVVTRSGGSFSGNVITASGQFNGNLQYGLSVASPLYFTSGSSFNNSAARTIDIQSSSNVKTNVSYVVQANSNGDFTARHITADNFYGTFNGAVSNANTIRTTSIATNANHYLTFVNSNNGTAAYENLYTDAGIYYNPSGNNLFVSGDITAFASDIRLKKDIEPIQNALDKVSQLSGFTYSFNEEASKYGFNTETRHSGVSAQEVQKVLPEAVCPAPASEDHLTVKYEKLVPLLIEAIKELRGEVTELRAELNELKGTK